MEILQTIWNVLTTENVTLTKLICAPLTFLEAYISMLIFLTILNITSTRRQRFVYVISFSVLAIFTTLVIPTYINTFINLLICPTLVFIIFKAKLLKSILAEILPYIIFAITGPIILHIYLAILNLSSADILNIPIYKFTYSLFLYVFVYLIYQLLKHFKFIINFIDNMKRYNSYIFLINLIVGLLVIAIQSYILSAHANYLSWKLIISSITSLLIYFIISLYSLSRTTSLEITTEKLEEEKLYNHTLTVLYDKIRGFKHDFNNIVQGLGGYIATNNMEGLKEYYSQVLDDCQRVNNLTLLSPEVINNPAIYSLLTSKYHDATKLGIKVNLEIFMDLSTINMKIYELTRILGILIDNAIEAAKECSEKEITVTIRKDNKKNKQLFIIENTYANKDVNIDEIFEKGKTSKTNEDAKNHGLGLWEVRQAVKRNKNLDLYTTKSEKYFKQQFEIYC